MKGSITLKILETIGNIAISTIDLIEVFLSAGYGTSYNKLQYELSRRRKVRDKQLLQRERQQYYKQKYYNLIYKLKRDGLIKEKIKNGKNYFNLTEKGRARLVLLKTRKENKLPEISYQAEIKNSNNFVIVIFDIPESAKRKRGWIRAALKNLGFKMVQKSVWLGKTKIPKRFLDDLFNLKLIDFVEIFEISKKGSLEHII